MNISGILAAIACGFLGMAVGAALQRWGDGVKASDHLSIVIRQLGLL